MGFLYLVVALPQGIITVKGYGLVWRYHFWWCRSADRLLHPKYLSSSLNLHSLFFGLIQASDSHTSSGFSSNLVPSNVVVPKNAVKFVLWPAWGISCKICQSRISFEADMPGSNTDILGDSCYLSYVNTNHSWAFWSSNTARLSDTDLSYEPVTLTLRNLQPTVTPRLALKCSECCADEELFPSQ